MQSAPRPESELEAKDLGGLVDALFADGEPEAAWLVTDVNPDWDPGERRWKRLAKSREESHPAQAMAVYLRLADIELETHRPVLLHPGGCIAQQGTACGRCGRSASKSSRTTFSALRERFRKRPALIEILDRSNCADS